MKNKFFNMVLLCSLVFCGCNKEIFSADISNDYENKLTKSIAVDSLQLNGINSLAFDLYKMQSRPNENLFFSPFCISSSFALIYPGSLGKTKDEIQSFFHFNENPDENSEIFRKLNNEISSISDSLNQVKIANALWIEEEFIIKESFFEYSKDYFNSEFYSQDFINAPKKSCDNINKWVSDKTNHKIENIINANSIHETTRLILTNAIYFNCIWSNTFDKNLTQNSIFYNSDHTIDTVKMMNCTSNLNYFEDTQLQVLEIPYLGNYSMIVLLPKVIENGIEKLEQNLNYQNYNKWLSSMSFKEVELYMPKFQLQNNIEFIDLFKRNGLNIPFTPMADFKGISDENTYIDKSYQYCYINVDETKTEAVAVGITEDIVISNISKKSPIVFNINHPFIFLIISKKNRIILFLGKGNVI